MLQRQEMSSANEWLIYVAPANLLSIRVPLLPQSDSSQTQSRMWCSSRRAGIQTPSWLLFVEADGACKRLGCRVSLLWGIITKGGSLLGGISGLCCSTPSSVATPPYRGDGRLNRDDQPHHSVTGRTTPSPESYFKRWREISILDTHPAYCFNAKRSNF